MSLNIAQGIARAAGIIGALQGLLPVIGQVVDSAEALFPHAGAGAQKLDWAVTFLKGALTKAGNIVTDVEALVPLLTGVINNVVAAAKTPAVPVIAPAPVVPAP